MVGWGRIVKGVTVFDDMRGCVADLRRWAGEERARADREAALADQAVIHQAAGMVSVHCRCSTDDAAALLTARAYATSQPAAQVARAVVHHGLRLD